VTVVEWGEGLVEGLSEDRLEIAISRPARESDDREVQVAGVGDRWRSVNIEQVLGQS